MNKSKINRQSGVASPHLLVLLAVIGVLAFLVISDIAPFRNQFFANLFNKITPFAANVVKTVGMNTGEKVSVICNGQLTSVRMKSNKTSMTVTCLSNVTPTPTPTMAPIVTPTSMPMPTNPPTGGGVGTNSYAMSLWTPNPKYDTCTVAQHDAYKVMGPDGKWYPTWHPATGPGGCTFGHEHGRDPKGSQIFAQAQQYFYYDANKNGVMDASEQAVSGLPFGYINEQYDVYNAAKGVNAMRHEDHVGHKVDWANGEGDIATDQNGNSLTGGVWIQKNANPKIDTGARCYFLAKPHQGVSTKDAFTMNIHEVFYFEDCTHSNTAYNSKASVAQMVVFGQPGGFIKFAPLCNLARREDPRDLICPLGKDVSGRCIKDSVNQNYPTEANGQREIISRDCVEIGMLVQSGTFSGNFYEAWPASLEVKTPAGKNLIGGINLLFDVEDANRYYYPDDLKAKNGYNNPEAGPQRGFTMDLCYETMPDGRKMRGGPCETATQYGSIKGITWDDPRSAFKGVHRGMYFQPGVLQNAGGPEVWYTDPFGRNAQTTPFAGSIKQQVSSKNLDYSSLLPSGYSIDPRVNDRVSNGTGVHAPN